MVTWNKITKPDSTKTTSFFLLQESGGKILQENTSRIIVYSLIADTWNKITKSTGIIWNKI